MWNKLFFTENLLFCFCFIPLRRDYEKNRNEKMCNMGNQFMPKECLYTIVEIHYNRIVSHFYII